MITETLFYAPPVVQTRKRSVCFRLSFFKLFTTLYVDVKEPLPGILPGTNVRLWNFFFRNRFKTVKRGLFREWASRAKTRRIFFFGLIESNYVQLGLTGLNLGLTGLEPVTLRLSSACSNQRSYRPGSKTQVCGAGRGALCGGKGIRTPDL